MQNVGCDVACINSISARPWQPLKFRGSLTSQEWQNMSQAADTTHGNMCHRWVQTQSILFQNSSEKNASFNSLYPLTKFLTGWGIQKHPKSIAASIAAPVPVMRNLITQRKSNKVWLQIHCPKSLWNPWSWAPGLLFRASRKRGSASARCPWASRASARLLRLCKVSGWSSPSLACP